MFRTLKIDVSGITDNISFPSNGNFSGKMKILRLQISGSANLEKILYLMHYQNWVKNVLSFGK